MRVDRRRLQAGLEAGGAQDGGRRNVDRSREGRIGVGRNENHPVRQRRRGGVRRVGQRGARRGAGQDHVHRCFEETSMDTKERALDEPGHRVRAIQCSRRRRQHEAVYARAARASGELGKQQKIEVIRAPV